MNKKEGIYLAIVLLFLFLSFSFVFSEEDSGVASLDKNNLTLESQSRLCLSNSENYMKNLFNEGFSILRVNETLEQARDIFNTRVEKAGVKDADFQLVVDYCNDIEAIYTLAYVEKDEVSTLKRFYNESVTASMNSTEVDLLIGKIDQEMFNERYENVQTLVDQSYEEIISLQSQNTALESIKRNTRNFIIRFITNNWEFKLGFLIGLIIILFLIRKPVLKSYLNNKIDKLEIRRLTLKKLIKKTQKQYFESGILDEGTYNIRTAKFAELIRDIDRQVPLIKEEIAKLENPEKKVFSNEKRSLKKLNTHNYLKKKRK